MDLNYKKLEDLFLSDPSKAIEECQKIICLVTNFDSYKDFFTYHLENAHMSTCQNEWTNPQLCIYCRDCAAVHPACICLPCFLNGNHNGHNYVILADTPGNCDCGDLSHWKITGTCTKHRQFEEEKDNPENYIDEKLRTTLTDYIFKAAFMSIKQHSINNPKNATIIFQFISSFLKFGDGFRRLVSRSLTVKINFKELMINIPDYGPQFNESLQQLCGFLVNDQLFIRNFSIISYSILSDRILEETIKHIGQETVVSYQIWDDFWFHSFSKEVIRYSIEKNGWDWVTFTVKIISFFKEIFKFVGDEDFNEFPSLFLQIFPYLRVAPKVQPNGETQLFFDTLVSQVLSTGSKGSKKNDTTIITSFNDFLQDNHFFPIYPFLISFYDIFESFKNKPNLRIEKLIDEMDKELDISPIFMVGESPVEKEQGKQNENDKLISRFLDFKNHDEIKRESYRSFHNGSSFFLHHTLYYSFVSLFKVDNIMRIKIARLLSLEKYQNLRVRLSIVTLKTILSFICNRQNLTSSMNHGVTTLYNIFNNPDMATKFITKFYPVFQLLIGLQSNSPNDEFSMKEFFAFEMARELGIFDDFSSKEYKNENVNEKQKQMTFTFLYLSLLLVTERTLFNYSGCSFIEEQLVFALKRGVHSIDKLNKLYDNEALKEWAHLWSFNDVLMSIATTTTSKKSDNDSDSQQSSESQRQETSFYLKEGIQWKTISAINLINDQMTVMNNAISKESDKLLDIPDFQQEETYFFHPVRNAKDDILNSSSDEENEDNNDEDDRNNEDSSGLKIRLKKFLMTPTVFSVIYHSLRSNEKPVISDLNDHLSMNILILVSKFIKEEEEETNLNSVSNFDDSLEIQYASLFELITKLKKNVFKYHCDDSGNAFIEDTLNQATFVSLLKVKINKKSFIDILLEKGKIGRYTLDQISSYIHLDILDKGQIHNECDIKEKNRQRANKLKADIMNHYKNAISDFIQQKGSDSIEDSTNYNADREVCSICSTYKEKEVFCYPLYMYITKFPFIVDKPPMFQMEEPGVPIEEDNTKSGIEYDYYEDEEEEEEESKTVSIEGLEPTNPGFAEQKQQTIQLLLNAINPQSKDENKATQEEKKEFKRCTAGANFIVQFSMCKHPVHMNCCPDKFKQFNCPIDRSIKNSLLPCIDSIPISAIFKKLTPLIELNLGEENDLLTNIVDSIFVFVDKFTCIFDLHGNRQIDVFVEFVKSISGLITTYEIRLRNLPDCLDSEKNKLLARNLFKTVWIAYRLRGRNKMILTENSNIDCETRMTVFQRFIKRLIEMDEIEWNINEKGKEEIVKKIVSSLIIDDPNEKVDMKRKEKEKVLFLRRVCLAEYFLLNIQVSPSDNQDIIDWDEVLSCTNLSQRYGVRIDQNDEEIEFKPFTFINLPKEFLRFGASPFNFPVELTQTLSIFSLIDYNFLISHYDDYLGEIVIEYADDEVKKNQRNLVKCLTPYFGSFLKSQYGNRNYPSVVLCIGKYASRVFLVNQSHFSFIDAFYVDKYGCMDIGYKRSQPLFLNEQRYEKCIDMVLSGDFSYILNDLSVLNDF